MEAARRELGHFLAENPGISRDDTVVVDVEGELEELLVNIIRGCARRFYLASQHRPYHLTLGTRLR